MLLGFSNATHCFDNGCLDRFLFQYLIEKWQKFLFNHFLCYKTNMLLCYKLYAINILNVFDHLYNKLECLNVPKTDSLVAMKSFFLRGEAK